MFLEGKAEGDIAASHAGAPTGCLVAAMARLTAFANAGSDWANGRLAVTDMISPSSISTRAASCARAWRLYSATA